MIGKVYITFCFNSAPPPPSSFTGVCGIWYCKVNMFC